MNAKVIIVKSFDEGKEYEKELERGDLKEFFEEEGDYLERLSDMMRSHA